MLLVVGHQQAFSPGEAPQDLPVPHTAQLYTAPMSANSENPLLARSLYVCLSVLSSGCCITLFSHPSRGVHKQDSQKFWVHLTPLPPPVASHWHTAHALHSSILSAYPRPRKQCTRTADLPRGPGASLSPGSSSVFLFARCILKPGEAIIIPSTPSSPGFSKY